MAGLWVVFWKELADHFGSRRFTILFLLICFVGMGAVYTGAQGIGEEMARAPTEFIFLRLFTTYGGALPSFLSFLSFFGPLMGIILGFDAVNGEHARGTISRVLAQPLFRDSWINGKFLAGLATVAISLLSIILIILGLGIRMLGFGPEIEELWRIGLFWAISVVYVGFWLSVGILFSVAFRQTTSSALASIATWLFFTLFLYMLAGLVADQVAPLGPEAGAEVWSKHERIKDMILRASPATLFEEATRAVLMPTFRGLSLIALLSEAEVPTNPLPWTQSLLIVWPELVSLIALTAICFAISYTLFMRREIRAI